MTTQTLVLGGEIDRWEQATYAFLAEKERRSGSTRTIRAYSRMLYHFFGALSKTPDEVSSQEVFAYAHSIGTSGRKPSSVTVAARIACLSSFYRFLIRMEMVTSNPCDKLERPKATPAPPRGLAAADIQKLLAVIPDTPMGLRDRAIILVLTLTGRRWSEVLGLKAGNLRLEGGASTTPTGVREAREVNGNCLSQHCGLSRQRFLPSARSWPIWSPTSPCGLPAATAAGVSPVGLSTGT
jgi:site-specific recombinase XerD